MVVDAENERSGRKKLLSSLCLLAFFINILIRRQTHHLSYWSTSSLPEGGSQYISPG